MANTVIFEALAEDSRFAPELRQRIRALSIQLQNLPQDDGLNLAIEALGFATLVFKDVPQEVAGVIESIPAGLDDAQREALKTDMAKIVDHAISTPSFEDLRTTLEMMRTHQRKVRNETEGIMRLLGRTHRALKRKRLWIPALGLGLMAGIISGLLVLTAFKDGKRGVVVVRPLAASVP